MQLLTCNDEELTLRGAPMELMSPDKWIDQVDVLFFGCGIHTYIHTLEIVHNDIKTGNVVLHTPCKG